MKSKFILRKWLLILSIGLLSMYVFSACSTSTVTPGTGPTAAAPTLTWKVFNVDDHTTQTYTGNDSSIKASQGTAYTITLLADDPDGVHQITLGSSTAWSCRSGNIGQNIGPSLDKTDVQNLNPDSKGKVLTSIFLLRNITTGPYTCEAGFTFSGGYISLIGTSTNFASQKTQSMLTFTS